MRLVVFAFKHMQREPGRDGKSDQQTHQHRHGHVQRHGGHVGTHHPGNEEHRHKGDDHGEGGQDNRRTHLIDRTNHGVHG